MVVIAINWIYMSLEKKINKNKIEIKGRSKEIQQKKLKETNKDLDKDAREELAKDIIFKREVLVFELNMLDADGSNTSAETFAELSKHVDEDIREKVADNISTPPETLAELSKDLSDCGNV